MSTPAQRLTLMRTAQEAVASGARPKSSCAQLGISLRTLQRWQRNQVIQGHAFGDARTSSRRSLKTCAHALSHEEQAHALAVMNSLEFAHLPPSQIVPRLADLGRYIGSVSTLYRILRQHDQMAHRRLERAARQIAKPAALVAHAPNQIYCWDITYLPSHIRGQYFYLYLFVDLFSRCIVGWQVFDHESAELASQLLIDICERQRIAAHTLTVHSDNGSPMKGSAMLSTMQALGVRPSRSRPSVSNDNPYSESLFRTLKYRPDLPVKPWADLLGARRWATELVHWYNDEHRHCSISFVTPAQRHAGEDENLLLQRRATFEQAKAQHPRRWSGPTRSWHFHRTVHLNPDSATQHPISRTQKAA